MARHSAHFHYEIAANLGVKLKGKRGFPVGKVTIRHLHPLSFVEFLLATDKSGWVNLLREHSLKKKIPELFHNHLTEALKTYLFVGGMPEAVAKYIQNNNFEEVRQVHKDILRTYKLDFAKHATSTEAAKISLIWDTIPSQLSKENKKFIYSILKTSARAREYESAIQWLVDANLVIKCYNISKPSIPLKSYANLEIFKTYFLDVGLLGAMSQLRANVLLDGHQLFTEYKGALTENYIAQSLTNYLEHQLFYWTSEGKAEVDFIVDLHGNPLPIEVKSGKSTKKKSLQFYCKKFSPDIAIRASLMNIKFDGVLLNIPLYAISELPRYLKENEHKT